MRDDDALRDLVAAQLAGWSSDGQPLNTDAERSTAILYASDIQRRITRRKLILRYLDRQAPEKDGRSAIVTAGPPGAGKSTMLAEHVADLDGYRLLDADIIKEYLIEEAIRDGIYNDLLTSDLADGHCIAPGELSPLVHRESTSLIDIIRRICLGARENIVVEGTLFWHTQGPDIFREIEAANYSTLDVLGLEVDRETAHRQALSRWWDGRAKWIAGEDDLGGRFTPPAAIDNCYREPATDEATSVCGQHALQMIDLAQKGSIPSVSVTIFRRTVDGQLEPAVKKEHFE